MKSKILLSFIVLLFALASSRLITADTPLDYGSPGNNNPNPQDCGVWLEISDVMRNADDDQNKQSHYDSQSTQHEALDREHTPSDEDEDDLKSCVITGSAGAMGGTLTLMEIAGQTKYNYKLWKDKYKRVEFTERSWVVAPHSSHYEEFFIEGYEISDQKYDIVMKATMDCPGGFSGYDYYLPAHAEQVDRATVWEADLDIDSKNLAGVEPPVWGLDTADDRIEHCEEEAQPGKCFVPAVNKDSDGDGTPDFADGLGLAAATGGGTSGTCGAESRLVPIRVELRQPIDPENAVVIFSYNDNIPRIDEGFTQSGTGTPDDPYLYKLKKAGLRLWAVDAPQREDNTETKEDVTEWLPKRKFIPQGKPVRWRAITTAANSSGGAATLYVEYVEDSGTLIGKDSLSGKREVISVTETAESGQIATDLVHVTLLPVELDVNGDGDLDDPCDGFATYLPGYELSTAKLHTGTSFENSKYDGPQSMNIIIDNLPSSIADEAHIRIVAASKRLGYCGNGSIANESPILPYKDFSLYPQATVSWTEEATVASTGNKMVIPIYCHDYGGWCEVEITLKKNGATIGSPIKLTLPHDDNGDELADVWQRVEVQKWNQQFQLTKANSDWCDPDDPDDWGKVFGPVNGDRNDQDRELADSDGTVGPMPAMADKGDGLTAYEEYRGFILDHGPGITSTQHRRLSVSRKEALFQFLVMPQITDGSNPGNCANTAAQGFDAADRFQVVHGFYSSKYPGGGADLDCYMVELPLIPDASKVVRYPDNTTRPAYLENAKLAQISGHTRPSNALTYIHYDERLYIEDPAKHNEIYSPDLKETPVENAFERARAAAEALKGPGTLDHFAVCAFYNRFGFYSKPANWNLGVFERSTTSFSNHLPLKPPTIPTADPSPRKRGCQFAVNAISEDPSNHFSNGQMDYTIAHEIGHTLIWARNSAHPGSYPGLMADFPYGTVVTSLSQFQIHSDVISLVDLRNRSSVVK
jgi:hypothetical protein